MPTRTTVCSRIAVAGGWAGRPPARLYTWRDPCACVSLTLSSSWINLDASRLQQKPLDCSWPATKKKKSNPGIFCADMVTYWSGLLLSSEYCTNQLPIPFPQVQFRIAVDIQKKNSGRSVQFWLTTVVVKCAGFRQRPRTAKPRTSISLPLLAHFFFSS